MEATEPDHNSSLENKNMLNQCVVRSTVEVASSLVLYQTLNRLHILVKYSSL